MNSVTTSPRKKTAERGVQMLTIGFMMNIGLTIIGFLALIQFFWILFPNERNGFIADLGVTIREWYSEAILFLLANSENKPFPWRTLRVLSIRFQCNNHLFTFLLRPIYNKP